MSTEEFIKLVVEMRQLQQLYFKTRTKSVLKQSKEIERQVDEYLFSKRQLNLFDHENK
jgi:hypothetical protein